MYSDILGQSGVDYKGVKSPRNEDETPKEKPKPVAGRDAPNFDRKEAKVSNLKSSLDTYNYDPAQYQQEPEPVEKVEFNNISKKTTAIKVKELCSDVLGTGSAAAKYANMDNKETVVVDLDLKNLKETTDKEEIKKISGVKHVISAAVDTDSIRNVCVGTGRIKMRLGPDDDLECIKFQYQKKGITVEEHSENPCKKSAFTAEMTLTTKSP